MSLGHIEYAGLAGTHVFKLVGEVRAQACCGLDHLLNKMATLPDIRGVIVDLNDAIFIDSTTLGVIAKLGIKLKQRYNIVPILLSTNADLTTLANSMGLGQIFNVVSTGSDQYAMQTLPDQPSDNTELLHTVLEAHRTLMNLSASNHAMFEPLVKQLEREERQQQQQACQMFSLFSSPLQQR